MERMESAAGLAARMADCVIRRLPPARIRWHYEEGFLLQALQRLGRPEDRRYVRDCMDRLIDADGRIRDYDMQEFNLDQINAGKVLFALLKDSGDARYGKALACLREQMRLQPRTRSGGFWHKKIYPCQMWLDGLYMAGPFLAQYAAVFGEAEAFHEVARQLLMMEEQARDQKTGLLAHGWDESRRQLWSNPENGRSPCFWARAIGWYAMALVDVLDFLPENLSDRQGVIAVLGRLLKAVHAFRDTRTGLWYQIMDQQEREGNYPEASANFMFIYALAKAARLGYVGDEHLVSDARQAYHASVRTFVSTAADGELILEGTCGSAGLGGNPYRDGAFPYYIGEKKITNDHKGVAAFINAALEMEKAE